MESRRFHVADAARLDAPERFESLPPAEVVLALAIAANDVIADIGAGTGYFTIPLAQATENGMVYAVDAQQGMLELLKKRSGTVQNIEIVHAQAEATGLQSGSCTLAFLANIWHEVDDRSKVLAEAVRILKENGRIAILDWRPDVERLSGPPLDHRLSTKDTAMELAAMGFVQIASRNIGKYSWLVKGTIFRG